MEQPLVPQQLQGFGKRYETVENLPGEELNRQGMPRKLSDDHLNDFCFLFAYIPIQIMDEQPQQVFFIPDCF